MITFYSVSCIRIGGEFINFLVLNKTLHYTDLCFTIKKISNFTLLDLKIETSELKIRATNIVTYIAVGSHLTLKWDLNFSRYLISLSRFKIGNQLCFAGGVNMMNLGAILKGFNKVVNYIEINSLGRLSTFTSYNFSCAHF